MTGDGRNSLGADAPGEGRVETGSGACDVDGDVDGGSANRRGADADATGTGVAPGASSLDAGGAGRVATRERTVLSDAWARLESVRFDYRGRDGRWQRQVREIYHRGHGAAILLHDLTRRTVVLVRQFRYPAHAAERRGFLLEVPAGMLEDGDPVATVVAETEQETGYRIGSPEPLFAAYVSPGSVTERIHCFAAPYEASARVGAGGGLADEGEDIEVLECDIDEALGWIGDGRIEDMKTIVLLQHAALHLFPPRA